GLSRQQRLRLMAREPHVVFEPAIGEAKVLVPEKVARDSVIHVRTLIVHPMHTGLFRTAEGLPIAAHFIDEVSVTYGGQSVARFRWTSGISRDPFVTFPLLASREAPVEVTWKDNLGGVFTQTAGIRFA
ncbi:MAG: thiosulfate oxidation carrier complex protein SoxZ, partial [Gemmatimonadota bacterium]